MIPRRGFFGKLAALMETNRVRDPSAYINPVLKPGEVQVDLIVVQEENGDGRNYSLRTYMDTTTGTFARFTPVFYPGPSAAQSFLILPDRVLHFCPIMDLSAPVEEDAIRMARYNPIRRIFAENGYPGSLARDVIKCCRLGEE